MNNVTLDFPKSLLDINHSALLELLHCCADDIRGKKQRDRYDNFKSCTQWSRQEYNAAYVFFKQLLCRVVANNIPSHTIPEQYSELPSGHVQCISDCLKVRWRDIEEGVRNQSDVSGHALQDFDWKLKWILGSSSLSSYKEPLLVLNFNMQEEKLGSHFSERVNLELNGSELKTLIVALEKAEESLRNQES